MNIHEYKYSSSISTAPAELDLSALGLYITHIYIYTYMIVRERLYKHILASNNDFLPISALILHRKKQINEYTLL